MTAYEIPLAGQPEKFTIDLGGKTYKLTVRWNDAGQYWALDIADSLGNNILTAIPLVTGCDLLAQFKYLDFGGKLYVQTDHDTLANPTYKSLGSNSHLFFVVE